MRVVFMGTPRLAAVILEKLAATHDVVGVFTRPDAVRGRGKKLAASEVGKRAEELGIDTYKPQSLKGAVALELLKNLNPDVVCVSAYGAILPPDMLAVPRFGCLNVHTSLLPRWRGAAPIERAILAGDEQTGVCVMRMEEGLDTGPYCIRRTVDVGQSNAAELTERLAAEGAQALADALAQIEAGTLTWTEQPEEGVCYAAKIAKGELNPALDDTAQRFVAKVRASSVGHPARASFAERPLAVEAAHVAHDELAGAVDAELQAGQAALRAKRLLAKTVDGVVEIQRVKPDGKKSMDALAFAGGIQGIKKSSIRWGSC